MSFSAACLSQLCRYHALAVVEIRLYLSVPLAFLHQLAQRLPAAHEEVFLLLLAGAVASRNALHEVYQAQRKRPVQSVFHNAWFVLLLSSSLVSLHHPHGNARGYVLQHGIGVEQVAEHPC